MKVLIPAPLWADYAAEAKAQVPTVELIPYDDGDAPVAGLEDAEGMLRSWSVRRWSDLVAQAPRLRWLHTVSAGVDGVLTDAVRNKPGLIVTDSGPAFSDAIPEFVMAWMLMVTRRLPQLIEQQRDHRWQWIDQGELYGRTVGIIGLGPIGLGIARRAKAFGMRVLGLRKRDLPAEDVDVVLTGRSGLDGLIRESDYIVLATPLTDETRRMIGAREFGNMKGGAWIINIARGALIHEAALIEALTKNRIAGACLDVFEQEPLPRDSPLWDLANVYIAPHNSTGNAPSVRVRQRQIFVENLRRFSEGAPLDNVVDINLEY